MDDDDKMLSKPQVCELLQISLPTLDRWVKRGWIKQTKFGRTCRYRLGDLRKCITEN